MHLVHGQILGDAVTPKVGIISKEKLSVLTLSFNIQSSKLMYLEAIMSLNCTVKGSYTYYITEGGFRNDYAIV